MSKENSSIENQLIDYFVSLSETDFTKRVLKPLFESMGYHPVDFYGGRDEGGKDLICWRNDDFDDKNLTVVQVKKTTASASASKGNSFGGIVNQLQQAKEKKVAALDGIERVPDSVLFITPYQIDTRALESRFEGMQSQRPLGIKVYDGTYIAKQVIKRLSYLLPEFIGQMVSIKDVQCSTLSNLPLLSSLLYKQEKDYKSFYIDLDFGVGKINSNVFLEWDFFPRIKELEVSKSDYDAFKGKINYYERFFNINCVMPSWHEVEENYRSNMSAWISEKNINNQHKLKELQEEMSLLLVGFKGALASMLVPLSTHFKVDMSGLEDELDDLSEKIRKNHLYLSNFVADISAISAHEAISYLKNNELAFNELFESINANLITSINSNKEVSAKTNQYEIKKVLTSIKSINQSLSKIYATAKKIEEVSKNLVFEPSYRIKLDCSPISENLKDKQAYLKQVLSSLDKKELDRVALRKLLIEFSALFEILDSLLNEKTISDGLNPCQKQVDIKSVDSLRNKIPIFDVFKTGINVAILGDAGAGKSTTLEMYARQANVENDNHKLTLYFPLTKVVDPKTNPDIDPFDTLERGILNFIHNNSNNLLTIDELRASIISFPESTFIFDGVDEVIKSAPWILEAINSFADYYSKSQIIISSRLGGDYLSQIKFLTVTVLPFTDEQLFDFIAGWFSNDQNKIDSIKTHLATNHAVRSVVRNPLLATILCVLAENNIPLPTKEISLYRERSKLLFGHYDIHKQTKRVESHHEILEDVARKIAFKLHSANKRMAKKDTLIEIAVGALGLLYSKDRLAIAVNELISSCNVIVEMSSDGEFGFGHLRFQEHLAAEEIVRNRGVGIPPLLISPWWRSVMVLFAQMTDNLGSILDEQLDKHAGIGPAAETIQAMLNVRPPEEAKQLKELVRKYKSIDESEDHTYWHDDNSYSY